MGKGNLGSHAGLNKRQILERLLAKTGATVSGSFTPDETGDFVPFTKLCSASVGTVFVAQMRDPDSPGAVAIEEWRDSTWTVIADPGDAGECPGEEVNFLDGVDGHLAILATGSESQVVNFATNFDKLTIANTDSQYFVVVVISAYDQGNKSFIIAPGQVREIDESIDRDTTSIVVRNVGTRSTLSAAGSGLASGLATPALPGGDTIVVLVDGTRTQK